MTFTLLFFHVRWWRCFKPGASKWNPAPPRPPVSTHRIFSIPLSLSLSVSFLVPLVLCRPPTPPCLSHSELSPALRPIRFFGPCTPLCSAQHAPPSPHFLPPRVSSLPLSLAPALRLFLCLALLAPSLPVPPLHLLFFQFCCPFRRVIRARRRRWLARLFFFSFSFQSFLSVLHRCSHAHFPTPPPFAFFLRPSASFSLHPFATGGPRRFDRASPRRQPIPTPLRASIGTLPPPCTATAFLRPPPAQFLLPPLHPLPFYHQRAPCRSTLFTAPRFFLSIPLSLVL